jgi:lipopolysaccharide transport system ATP-binding protein
MSDVALRTVGLGKMYRIGAERERYRTLRDTIVQTAKRPVERLRHPGAATYVSEDLWALRGVDLEVKHGEALGVIGRNGAGKTTLLKVLSHITEPSVGRVDIRGRVASLLEVGTGFHPELTGRENIQLNGAILGMTRAEIKSRFDEIVEFSEIGRFLDTPVKRYSSGMYVRLAFAVAAHLNPEILIVDEVLSVGDAAFQRKCLGKMGELGDGGRTVLFVSHNMVAVQNLCSRAVCLEGGRLIDDGPPHEVVPRYLNEAFSSAGTRVWADRDSAPGNELARIRSVCVRNCDGDGRREFTLSDPVIIEVELWNLAEASVLGVSLHLFDDHGTLVLNSLSDTEPKWGGRPLPVGLVRHTCTVPGNLLNDGVYSVTVLVYRNDSEHLFWLRDTVAFEVRDTGDGRGAGSWRWPGVIRPPLVWTTAVTSDGVDNQPVPTASGA